MVIFGGLEFVAAGYLVHRHHKHKKERARLQAAEAIEPHHQYHNQHQQQQYQYYHEHQNPRRHKTYPRPSYTNKPNPPPVYHYHNQRPKPEHYNTPISPHSAQSPQSARPFYQQSCLDLPSITVPNGTPPDQRYPHRPSHSLSYPQPGQNLSPVSPHQYSYPPQSSSTHLSPTTPTLPPRPHNGFYSASTPLAIASTPNLPQGYQANTGLSDDLDHMSIDGLEVYDPERPQPPRVHFAGLPDEGRVDEQNDPPPPYRP